VIMLVLQSINYLREIIPCNSLVNTSSFNGASHPLQLPFILGIPPLLAAIHPGGNPGANLKSISHRCHPILVAFVWELTKETIDLPLGCLQGG